MRPAPPPPLVLLLLLLLPLPPGGSGNNQIATTTSSPEGKRTTLPTNSSLETTQEPIIPATTTASTLLSEVQSPSKFPGTPKPSEAGNTSRMGTQPVAVPTVNDAVATSAKNTQAPTTQPSILTTQLVSLTSQVIKSSSPATTKNPIMNTSQDASIAQTTLNVTLPPHVFESPTSQTSLNKSLPVPRISSPATLPETTVTIESQSTLAAHGTPVPSESTVSVNFMGSTDSTVTSEGTLPINSESTASVTPGVTPTSLTVVSENSASPSTSSYFSHHQPPAVTTSGSEIFSPIPNKVTCQPDGHSTENLLILKMTNFSCDGIKDRNHPLYTALCRAGKANFNKDRDVCHVQLISQPEKQEVAVLNVSVQTHLQPKDLYEVLKKRWDDLKALGVSNMTYGNESLDKDVEDRFSMPLIITIVCMAAFLLLVAALYGCFHQRFTQRKDQQRLTEELQTVENGYHDNPTLEVMETSSEMQEKKVTNLNGELGDSWIVPLDNLTKDDLDQEEEDTHL